MNAFLFGATVLIWGTTWIAIAFQLGDVPVFVSVFYRFALAGALFLFGLSMLGRLQMPKRSEQPWIFAQSLCLFSFNFIMFYMATRYIPSGVVAVVFSLATVFNPINARIWFKDAISPRVFLASGVGVSGLALLFIQEFSLGADWDTAKGLGFACAGTFLFSCGNMISRRNSAHGLTPVKANAWGMLYGAGFVLAVIYATDTPMVAPPMGQYLWALLYLSLVGSVAGFTTYLMMVARMGSDKAAFATILFPLVALSLSTLFEGYEWSGLNALGLVMALAGNGIMFLPQIKGFLETRRAKAL